MGSIAELKGSNSALDRLEVELLKHPAAELPVTHRFTPGMYIREIFMPAGTVLTTMKHRTEHPFVITKGVVKVVSENEGKVILRAGHIGITMPGTRRALEVLEDTVWTTFHATTETDIEKIGEAILEPHENKLISKSKMPKIGWKKSLPTKKWLST